MEKNEIEIDEGNEISKSEYFFYDNEQATPNKKIIKGNKTKILNIPPDKIKYELIIEKGEEDTIIITINSKIQNNISKYQVYLNIQNFINLSPYFKLLYIINPIFCIDNFYSFIKSKLDTSTENNNNNLINLQNSKINISGSNTDKTNKIFLMFNIVYINLTKEEIKIPLKQIESYDDVDLINLYQILLRNKYNYINRINHLGRKFIKTQSSFDKYQTLLNRCNSYFDHDMQLKMSFLDLGLDTDILESPDHYNFIISIFQSLFANITNLSFEQLYKASCDGDNINAFHKKCDGIKNTLILIITDDYKRKFGGFTTKEWDKSNKYKFDDKAFLFSLDLLEFYPILDKFRNKAINCRENFYAPIFGNDLFIFDGFFTSKLNKTEEKYFDYSGSKNIEEEYKLTGQKYFTVTEMEVYKVNFFDDNSC